MSIVWYNSVDIFKSAGSHYELYQHRPGFKTFSFLFSYFAANASLIDRSGTVQIPINCTVMSSCTLPQFKEQHLTFEELCEQRARQLLDLARKTSRKLAVMYSGGIDSTLMLVSLLKTATAQELKDHVIVLMSEFSIRENPNFYHDYIKKCFQRESSYLIHAYLGNSNYIILTGEGNDQLFGSAVTQKIVQDRGDDIVLGQPNRGEIITSLNYATHDELQSEKIAEIFDRIVDAAPIEIPTLFHYYWWLNFVLKWQNVYNRLLCFTAGSNRSTVKPEDNYFSFYQNTDFQLWSMNNTDKMIQGNWRSYKYHCKEIIYAFNKDRDYLDNKAKWGSLARVMFTRNVPKVITSDMEFIDGNYPDYVWNDHNDFV